MSTFEVSEALLPKPNYKYITNTKDLGAALEDISKYPMYELDTETTGFDPYTKKIVLAQIGIPNMSYVFDVRSDLPHTDVDISLLKPVLDNTNQLKLLQNAAFDMKMIKVHAGYYLQNVYDTMLVEQLLNLGLMGGGASLKDLVKKYLGLGIAKEPGGTFQDYYQQFEDFQIEYAATDVSILSLIREFQLPRIYEEGFENVCRLEFDFLKPMCEMELNGVTIDTAKWRIIMKDYEEERKVLLKDIHKHLSEGQGQNMLFGIPTVNVDSNLQLKKALENMGLQLEGTDEKALKKYKELPVIDLLLQYRKLNKLISTYGESLLEKINPVTGRLHTRFRQMVSTGRLSSSDPNLQNIPHKLILRSCFIAKPGYKLITADMSSSELRIIGNLSDDPVFRECFTNHIDLHTRSASEVYKVDMDKVTRPMRNACKALSFGLCVDEDTELITDRGILKIKDVAIGDYVAHDTGNDKIIDKKFMGEKEAYTITTQFGYELTLTKDHVVKVINAYGEYVDKKVADLDIVNDQLCIKAGSNLFSDITSASDVSTRKVQETFLAKLFTGNKLYYTHDSIDVLRGLQLMLLNFGTFTSISKLEDSDKYVLDKLVLITNKDNIAYVDIKSIESAGVRKVYDISVENRELFLANGFVVHNCYGMSKYGLSARLGISVKEAQKLIEDYFTVFKSVKKYLEEASRQGVKKGYSLTASGRKRFYNVPPFGHPDRERIQKSVERKASNAPVQGCLRADTKIKGLGNISDLVSKRVELETGFGKDQAIGVYSGCKDVSDLTLTNGVNLGITLEHKLPVLNRFGASEKLTDKPVGELTSDDLIMVPLNVVEEGTATVFPEFAPTCENAVVYKTPKVMTKDLAFILGCLIGGGRYKLEGTIIVNTVDSNEEIISEFNTCIENVFGYVPKLDKRKVEFVRRVMLSSFIYSTYIQRFLEHIGLSYNVRADKKIPEYFYTETLENRGAFLKGLFSIRSNYTKTKGPQLVFTCSSKSIIEMVQQLLFTLGINSNVIVQSHVQETDTYETYALKIPRRFMTSFKKYVGLSTTVKQKQLEEYSRLPIGRDDSIVPAFIPKTIYKNLRRRPDYFTTFTTNEKVLLFRFREGRCSYTSWRKFYEYMSEGAEKRSLSKYLNMDFCTMKSLTYRGKVDTYDLMCDDIHYFTAGGVIVHNSNADTIKESMSYLVDKLEEGGYDAKLIMTVHDEIVVECRDDQVEEVAPLLPEALRVGFAKYFHKVPMESDALIGPCWLKHECEIKDENGNECGCDTMKFVPDEKYGTRLVCTKCGGVQE